MRKKAIARRAIREPYEEQPAKTLLDVYQNFTSGIYSMLKIKPAWIQGVDEITGLFAIIGNITMFLISLSYVKADTTNYVATLFNGSNFDSYGCNVSALHSGVMMYGLTDPSFAISIDPHQFSFSALLSASGRLQCESNISFVVASHELLDQYYPNITTFHPREGAEILTNQLAFQGRVNDYYTYSAKGAELGLSNYFNDTPLLSLLDGYSEKMYEEINRILSSKTQRRSFIMQAFKFDGGNMIVLLATVPILGILIAANLNLLHRPLRRSIVAESIKFTLFRAIIGFIMIAFFNGAYCIMRALGMDLDNYRLSDNLFKSIICTSLLLSGIAGKFLNKYNLMYAEEQAICSFIVFILSLSICPESASLFESICLFSVLAMYFKDFMHKKRITQRDWTRNACFILVQLPIAYALCYKQIGLLEARHEEISFSSFLTVSVIVVQTLIGYSISIYGNTSGPLVLFSLTGLAALVFLEAATANPVLTNFKNNLHDGENATGIPLLSAEIHAKVFCTLSKQECVFDAFGSNGLIPLVQKDDIWQFNLFKGRYTYALIGENQLVTEYSGMECKEVIGEVESQIIVRGFVEVWKCE